MSVTRHHAEWLSLLEVSGPFLSMPVLLKVFPQGLDAHDPEISRSLRFAYEEWDDNQTGKHTNPATHRQFIRFVLTDVLKVPEETIREGQTIPQTLKTYIPEHSETLRPDLAIYDPGAEPKPRLLIHIYPRGTDLEGPLPSKHWKATPATRMMELLHGTDCRLGLITNGERWMLVDAPRGDSTGFASWFASLWLEEQITLRSFRSLLSGHRFFVVATEETLEAMLAESAVNQQEVTEQLGYQVRQAVEVLVESIDKADRDRGGELTRGISEKTLYEAALAVMMRLVFLLSAEERKLLLLGDPIYDQHYAVSTLQAQLREAADQHGEEILEHRFDAWARLLATFRAVHAGMQHDRMMLPAYGGHLFDPDRYPFLEGRKQETSWRTSPASPLPINNRTVLHALEALQFLQIKMTGGGPVERRRLSFRALDVEQIGHVYEGLLDHTAKRASEPILGLRGTKDQEPEISLAELERRLAENPEDLLSWLEGETGRSEPALKNALAVELELQDVSRFHAACGNDNALWSRVRPFAGLVRDDTFGYPVVVLPSSVFVTEGEDRRSTGTHYTPKSLTEPIVQYALEPLVYIGPAEGKPKEEWKLRSAHELLSLKICDMTTGSGAFLAQACRYLSERLAEAWETSASIHPGTPGITPDGSTSTGLPADCFIPKDLNEKLVYAMRIVAQRCLYGVDKNHLAVEMAKLSMWLLTMAKDQPFTFLDHNIRCGDSLVGVDIEQLKSFSILKATTNQLFLQFLPKHIEEAIALRKQIAEKPTSCLADIIDDEELMISVDGATRDLKTIADYLLAPEFLGDSESERQGLRTEYSVRAARQFEVGDLVPIQEETKAIFGSRPTFHWQLEFPEVFASGGGFDALIGNPPFRGGLMITRDMGLPYTKFLKSRVTKPGATTDLCAYFLRKAFDLLRPRGTLGYLMTNTISEGDTRATATDEIVHLGGTIFRALPSFPWPGTAALHIAQLHIFKGVWNSPAVLNGEQVDGIGPSLKPTGEAKTPFKLNSWVAPAHLGTTVYGKGFFLENAEAASLIRNDKRWKPLIKPFLNGDEVSSDPKSAARRSVMCFQGMTLEGLKEFEGAYNLATQRIYAERQKSSSKGRREKWWLYTSPASDLYAAISSMERVIVTCFVSKFVVFTFEPSNMIFANTLVVIASDDFGVLALLQSGMHEIWVRTYSSTLETRQRYALSDCFETFPSPSSIEPLRSIGERLYELRSYFMQKEGLGLTDVYNLVHSPDAKDDAAVSLRHLHQELDEAVKMAYGFDFPLEYGFRETARGVRFTFSPSCEQRVLNALLQLNHEQHEREALHTGDMPQAKLSKRRRAVKLKAEVSSLFGNS
jgi:hypothetical protein